MLLIFLFLICGRQNPKFFFKITTEILSNGVSLTVCDSKEASFRVAIIPYTFEHTNFCRIDVGSVVNLEFDIVGKYIARLMGSYLK